MAVRVWDFEVFLPLLDFSLCNYGGNVLGSLFFIIIIFFFSQLCGGWGLRLRVMESENGSLPLLSLAFCLQISE